MLNKIPRDFSPKSILMLGLGGGSGIEVLRRKYPNSRITVIEHDPEMTKLAHQLVFSKIKYVPEVIEADAGQAVSTLVKNGRRFDVVIFDLFTGGQPSPLLNSEIFLDNIKKCLSRQGFFLVNFYRTRPELGPMIEKFFSKIFLVRSEFNFMAVYQQFGMGKVGDPIPKGFATRQQSEGYLLAGTRTLRSTIVGEAGARGLRYSWGWLALEVYACEKEPSLDRWRGLRLALWSPTQPVRGSRGWWGNPLVGNGWQIGVTETSEDYLHNWSEHAKRHFRKWLGQSRYVLHPATVEEFEKAYNASRKLDPTLRWAFMREVKSYIPDSSANLSVWLVHDSNTQKEIAGLATVDLTDISQTVHLVSFLSKEAQKTPVGYGLIAKWCEQSYQRGVGWMNFGIMWQPKDPPAWRGYTRFKQQFGLYLIRYPRPKMRLTLGI